MIDQMAIKQRIEEAATLYRAHGFDPPSAYDKAVDDEIFKAEQHKKDIERQVAEKQAAMKKQSLPPAAQPVNPESTANTLGATERMAQRIDLSTQKNPSDSFQGMFTPPPRSGETPMHPAAQITGKIEEGAQADMQGADFATRLKLGFATNPQEALDFLESKFGKGRVRQDANSKEFFILNKDNRTEMRVDELGWTPADLADMAAGAPEVVGSIVGGVAGTAAAGPGGGMAGAAVGGAVGEGIKQGIAGLYGFGQDRTPGEKAVDIMKAGGRGLMAEGIGQGVGAVAQGLRAPLRNKLTAEQIARIKRAKELGMPMTPSDIGKGRGSALMESWLNNLPPSAGVMQKTRGEQFRVLSRLAKEAQEGVGGYASLKEGGAAALSGLKETTKRFKNRAGQLYDDLENLVLTSDRRANLVNKGIIKVAGDGKENIVKPTNFMRQWVKIKSDPYVKIPGELTEFMAKNAKATANRKGGMTFSQTRQARSALGTMSETKDIIGNKQSGMVKSLRNAIEADQAVWAEQGKNSIIKNAYEKANSFYKLGDAIEKIPGIETINSTLARKIKNAASPDALATNIIRPRNLGEMESAKELLGPEAFQELKKAWLANAFKDKAKKLTLPGGEEIIAPGEGFFTKLYKNFSKEERAFLFDADELAKLDTLKEMADFADTAIKMAGNASGTGGVVNTQGWMNSMGGKMAAMGGLGGMGGAVGYGATGDPKDAAKGFVVAMSAPWLMAKFVLSKPVINALSRTTPISPVAKGLMTSGGHAAARAVGNGLMGGNK